MTSPLSNNQIKSIISYVNTIAPSELPNVQSELSQKLTSIKNSQKTLSNAKSHLGNAQENRKEYNRLEKSLGSVSSKHDASTTVRYKNSEFKAAPSSLLKSILHHHRYQKEFKEAASLIGNNSGKVSINDVKSWLVKQQQQTSASITEQTERLNTATHQLEQHQAATPEQVAIVEEKLARVNLSISDITRNGKAEQIKKDAQQKTENKNLECFANLYQSNEGCRAINQYMRSGNSRGVDLDTNKVISEYRKAFGHETFYGAFGKDLKSSIQNSASLDTLTKLATNKFYTPGSRSITTYRGQDMTLAGLDKLMQAKNTGTAYRLAQFFSTSNKAGVAETFIPQAKKDHTEVFITMHGNSGSALPISSSLIFSNHEDEHLYSPRACVKVTSIEKKNGRYNITLQEVTESKQAARFPY